MTNSTALKTNRALDDDPRPLDQIAVGSHCQVVAVRGNPLIQTRLLDLGFHPDTLVRVVRRAPWGDPSEYELRGYRICLRKQEASSIFALPVEPSHE